jgi:hypothetical protein
MISGCSICMWTPLSHTDTDHTCERCIVLSHMEKALLSAISHNISPYFNEEVSTFLANGSLKDRVLQLAKHPSEWTGEVYG